MGSIFLALIFNDIALYCSSLAHESVKSGVYTYVCIYYTEYCNTQNF